MKLTEQEYLAQLAIAQDLPAEARKTMLNTLKAAEVVDEGGRPMRISVFETPAAIKTANPELEKKAVADAAQATNLTLDAIEQMVRKVYAEAAPEKKAAPIQAQPKAEPGKVTIPAEVKRFGAIQNFQPGKRCGMEQDERAYLFGMWCSAAIDAARGQTNTKSAEWCRDKGIEVKVHSEGTNTAGGYSVPDILSSDFIDLKESYGVARRLFDKYQMTSDTLKINRRTGGLTVSFTAENAAASESTMSIDQVQLVAKDATAITRVSGQLNADSIINWADKLAYEIGYGFANKEDLCGFNGDATSTYGGMTGLRTALTNKWTPGVPGTGVGLIKQGTSNTWATMVMADFDAVVGALPQYADTNRCVWVMHRTFYYTVVEKLIQAAGGVPAYEVRQGQRAPRPLFKGYPVEFSQVYPSTSTTAQVVATLGDHALAVAFGDRQMDSIDFSTQASVGGQSMWERNQIGVRGIERFDIVVHDVGDGSTVAGPVVGLAVG